MAVGRELIKKAILKRADEFRIQKDTITMKAVRRLLERDLGLETKGLDTHKTFVDDLVVKVISGVISVDASEPAKKRLKSAEAIECGENEAAVEAEHEGGGDEKLNDDEQDETNLGADSGPADGDIDNAIENEEVDASEEEYASSEEINLTIKKRKAAKKDHSDEEDSEEEKVRKSRKRKQESDEESDGLQETDDEGSDDEQDMKKRTRQEKQKQQKERKVAPPKPVYGKMFEKLREIFQACGLRIPPSVYRKAGRASGKEKDEILVKELEALLEKEGLSADPSKEEIKAVKKRRQKQKELEGIDLSNVIEEPRGRRGRPTSFAPPPKYKVDDDESSGSEEVDDADDDDDEEDAFQTSDEDV